MTRLARVSGLSDGWPGTPAFFTAVSIIVSKGSLEGIYPALIMASGAPAEGVEANLFFALRGPSLRRDLAPGAQHALVIMGSLGLYPQCSHDHERTLGLLGPAGPVCRGCVRRGAGG